AQGRAALLAVDAGDRREGRAAGLAAAEHLAAALLAPLRDLRLELLEPAPGGAAAGADGHPVAEHLATLLAQPVRGLAHPATVASPAWPRRRRTRRSSCTCTSRGRCGRRRCSRSRGATTTHRRRTPSRDCRSSTASATSA